MHLLTLKHTTPEFIKGIVDKAIIIKISPKKYQNILKGKTLIMLFQKTSTRTRCSFETAMTQLGGHAQYLDWHTTNLTLGSLQDEIQCLARYADIIMARVYKQSDLESMANVSQVPIINGLSDMYHPCQVLADLLTIKEKFGKLKNIKLAFIGDGNNVCHSLIIGCSKANMKITVATPRGFEPDKKIIDHAKQFGEVRITNNAKEVIKKANIIYTDTWISMGQETETKKRLKVFKPYQVNKKLIGESKALIMHCLPAHRGYEISNEVLDSKYSIVFDQAENRLHAQKTIILKLLNII